MYVAFALGSFQTQFAYRSQVWALIFGELMHLFAYIGIWIAVYAGQKSVAGATLRDMVTYAVMSGTVLTIWYPALMIDPLARALKTGDVAMFLLKPISYPLYLLATEIGHFLFLTLAVAIPIIAIVATVYGIEPPASLFHGVMFVGFWALSFLVSFALGAIAGILAFWFMTAFSLDSFLRSIIMVFSGMLVPLWLFPEPLGSIARQLPFAWIAYYPPAVYLGKLDVAACWSELAVGLFWLAALGLVVMVLWRRTAGRLTIQGG